MNLEELEKQVTLMEDIQEIENLQRRYAYYFDLQRWRDIVDLFSDCSPFEDGWIKTPLMGLMNYHPTVKPDASPTAFHPYPSGYHVPYHYKHPVMEE
ncbi:MAG: nuclear transport factor 2 family protein [Thermodesulfobacteriota bacterium]|jgi:hypothetical protein